MAKAKPSKRSRNSAGSQSPTPRELKVELWPIDKLLPYVANARTHPDEQVAQIAGSIAEFGFNVPCLVDDRGVLITGHGRLLAARRLGLGEVPVIRLGHPPWPAPGAVLHDEAFAAARQHAQSEPRYFVVPQEIFRRLYLCGFDGTFGQFRHDCRPNAPLLPGFHRGGPWQQERENRGVNLENQSAVGDARSQLTH